MSKRLFLLMILLVAVDQASKYWADGFLPFKQAVPVMPFFSLFLTYNDGVAFSMLSWVGSGGLIAFTVLIIAFIGFLWWRLPASQHWASFGFALIMAGALGNLIDRAVFGHVIDYFLFHTQTWSFAVFNVADSYISIGAFVIIVDELFFKKTTPPPNVSD